VALSTAGGTARLPDSTLLKALVGGSIPQNSAAGQVEDANANRSRITRERPTRARVAAALGHRSRQSHTRRSPWLGTDALAAPVASAGRTCGAWDLAPEEIIHNGHCPGRTDAPHRPRHRRAGQRSSRTYVSDRKHGRSPAGLSDAGRSGPAARGPAARASKRYRQEGNWATGECDVAQCPMVMDGACGMH
jgi:hypothetical protein